MLRHLVHWRTLALFLPVYLAAQDRVVDPVDRGRKAPVRGNRHPLAVLANDRGLADPAAELSYAVVLLQPAAGLDGFLRDLQDPKSPNYRKWLTPEQFAERFGASAHDAEQVAAWLRAEGLEVHDVARGRLWITFSGPAGRVARALGTEFRRYRAGGRDHVANASDPLVPAALASVIAGFDGLNDFEPVPLHKARPLFNSSGAHYLSPDDFATIYNVKPLYGAGIDGTGVGIAVIGRSAITLSDIQTFRRQFGLPAADPKLVLFGSNPGVVAGDVDEASLDIEWAGAVAPNASISYVYATNVRTALQYAIDQNIAPIITYSYGGCELGSTAAVRSLAQQANAQGITFMAASGDWGSATCDYIYAFTPQAAKGPTVTFPANIPEVTAVGGTQFNDRGGSYWAETNAANGGSALSYIPEEVWNESVEANDFVASGGGSSSYFPKPYWQTGPGVPSDNSRHVPDLALTSSAAVAPYLVVRGGRFLLVGGTSAASPAFAGVVALLNQQLVKQGTIVAPGLGNINPMLYRLAQTTTDVFHDIVAGDNKVACVQSSPGCVDGKLGYAAAPGFDLTTGLGSIDAEKLVTKWNNGTASTTTLTATPAQVDLGTTVKLTAVVAGAGSVAPSGAVVFLANDAEVGSATLAPAGGAMTAAVSVAAAQLVVGTGVVTAFYSGDGIYSNSSGTAAVTLNTPSKGSLVVPFVSPNPIPQTAAGNWAFTLGASEKAGVATRITGITLGGSSVSNLLPGLNNGNLPAKGTVSVAVQGGAFASLPTDQALVFSGEDADGTKWTQQVTATFTGPLGPAVVPAVTLSSTPQTAQQNLSADPSCRWSHDLTLDEHGGYFILLTRLVISGADFTGQIQPLFGAQRLAPYGVLRATICWDAATVAGSTKSFAITGTAENGATVTATTTVTFAAAATAPAALSVAPQSLELTAADNQHDATAAIDLGFGGAAIGWKASVTPANATTGWLKASPISGTGAGQVAIRAATSGLSRGVYRAAVALEMPGAVPDHFVIPVTLVVGASELKIGGAVNAASFEPAYAPGMLLAVFGAGLSTTAARAPFLPLPLTLGGITATVNGVAAPILGTFPESGQVNLQVPYEAGIGPAVLAINNGGKIAYTRFTITAAAPGLFGVWDTAGRPVTTLQAGQAAVAWITGDGDVTPFLPTGDTPLSGTPAGQLPRARQPLAVTIGGVPATVLFAAVPSGVSGATQINFTVPTGVNVGTQAVVVTVGGVKSQAVMVTVQ